jgi:predicted HTH domain antitoxin
VGRRSACRNASTTIGTSFGWGQTVVPRGGRIDIATRWRFDEAGHPGKAGQKKGLEFVAFRHRQAGHVIEGVERFLNHDDVYDALSLPEEEREAAVKRELAVSPYARSILSFGKARELAGLSKRAFHALLGDQKIERHYTGTEFDEDIEYARG